MYPLMPPRGMMRLMREKALDSCKIKICNLRRMQENEKGRFPANICRSLERYSDCSGFRSAMTEKATRQLTKQFTAAAVSQRSRQVLWRLKRVADYKLLRMVILRDKMRALAASRVRQCYFLVLTLSSR